jgi:hypothetical protein
MGGVRLGTIDHHHFVTVGWHNFGCHGPSGNKGVNVAFAFRFERWGCAMSTAARISARRGGPRRRDNAQVLYLHHAARSAGEAFGFEEESVRSQPRSGTNLVWIALAVVAAIALYYTYS